MRAPERRRSFVTASQLVDDEAIIGAIAEPGDEVYDLRSASFVYFEQRRQRSFDYFVRQAWVIHCASECY